MDEDDYIQLQNLLTKLRVCAMKNTVQFDQYAKIKEKNLKIIRYIDYFRKNIPLIIDMKKEKGGK